MATNYLTLRNTQNLNPGGSTISDGSINITSTNKEWWTTTLAQALNYSSLTGSTLLATGAVGIGTTTPGAGAVLDVYGTTYLARGTANRYLEMNADNPNLSYIDFHSKDNATGVDFDARIISNGGGGNNTTGGARLDFYGSTFYMSGTPGNVGIGTTIPVSILTLSSNGPTPQLTTYRATQQADGSTYTVAGVDAYFTTRDTNINLGGFVRILDTNTNGGFPTAVRGGAITFGTIDGATGFGGNPAVERMRITPSGNVGIGTATPAQLLDITNASSSTPAIRLQNQYAAGYLSMGAVVGVNSYIGLQAGVNTTSALTTPTLVVTNAGTVGIGTTNPAATFEVYGSAHLARGAVNRLIEFGSAADTSFIDFHSKDSSTGVDYDTRIVSYGGGGNNVNGGGRLEFVGSTFVMTGTPGNVGIGTTAPGAKFQVHNSAATYTSGPTVSISDGVIDLGGNYGMVNLTRPADPADNKGHICLIRAGQNTSMLGYYYGLSGTNVLSIVCGGDMSSLNALFITNAVNGGNVGIGVTNPSSKLQVNGSLAKSSGTFDIPHPLYPESSKRLVHSFIEGPRCDLIYRGTIQLQGGQATVNMNTQCTELPSCAMDEGTFQALCTNPQFFLQNITGFARVRGSISGSTLTIVCEDASVSDTISWLVVAERKDPFIKQWDRTDVNGYLITQYDASVNTTSTSSVTATNPI